VIKSRRSCIPPVGGSLALLSGPHFSYELLSANRPSTLTLTAEAEALKLHESCYQPFSYLKPVSSKAREVPSLLSNFPTFPLLSAVDTSATTRRRHMAGSSLAESSSCQANASFPKPSLSHHCAQITRLPDEESPSIIPCLTTASHSALSLALILACTLKSPWFALPHLLMTV